MPNAFKTFFQHEDLTNVEDRWCQLHSSIPSLGTFLQIQRLKKTMWTLNLDYFKNCCLIILCGSGALLMQLMLLAHEVKDCVNCMFVVG